MMFLKSRIQTSQDKLKQYLYCFKFLLVQVAGIFFVLKILTFVVVLFFSSFLIQPLLSLNLLIFYGEKVVVVALAVVVSLATCSNVFALLTLILENSFTLSLAF